MEFQDNEEDCTIYIEELKSDDPNLKINAVVKIQQIAGILGPNRVRDELIPYLIEIIEELDNEDEFLIQLAEQILGLKTKIGGTEHSHLLIAPLEILSSMEEPAVREKAVNCLVSLSDNQPPAFYSDHFIAMIKQLAGLDNFPSRISACTLLTSCFKNFSDSEQQELQQVFKQLCEDDTPMVRRIAAQSIQLMVDQLSYDVVQNQIFPHWQHLASDEVDSVKSMAIESAYKLINKLNNKETNDEILAKIKQCLENKTSSWRIRYGVAETLGQIHSFYDKETVKKEIYSMFEQLLKDPEQEVRSISLDKLPLICKNLSVVIIANSLLPILNSLLQDQSYHVRTSLAEIICKIGESLEKQAAISGIIPIIELLLKDDVLDVRLMLLGNLHIFNAYIGVESVLQNVMPLFANIISDKLWRYRLAFAKFIPELAKQIGFQAFKEQLINFTKSLLEDHYSAIRDQCFINLQSMCKDYGYDLLQSIIWDCCNQLKAKQNYVYRITAIQGIILLKPYIIKKDVNDKCTPFLEELLKDKVVNVLICAAKLFLQFKDQFTQGNSNKIVSLLEKLKTHQDIDVQYQVSLALN